MLEHVLYARWNRYLEAKGLYPNTMLGFRAKLATQDTMLLIKKEIVDTTTLSRDSKATLGLDLQGAFDNVKHTAILKQVSALHMGRRFSNYIQAFLSKRTVTIRAGDIELPTKELGSTGTPQGSVIFLRVPAVQLGHDPSGTSISKPSRNLSHHIRGRHYHLVCTR